VAPDSRLDMTSRLRWLLNHRSLEAGECFDWVAAEAYELIEDQDGAS
jgi:hypothetical protein